MGKSWNKLTVQIYHYLFYTIKLCNKENVQNKILKHTLYVLIEFCERNMPFLCQQSLKNTKQKISMLVHVQSLPTMPSSITNNRLLLFSLTQLAERCVCIYIFDLQQYKLSETQLHEVYFTYIIWARMLPIGINYWAGLKCLTYTKT